MKPGAIRFAIVLGIVSLMSILFTQVLWIQKSLEVQQKAIEIQDNRQVLNQKHFIEQVHIALRNVLQQISKDHSDHSDLYGAVKQVSANYFIVDINEELHPFYLENLLKRELYAQNISTDFQYGIYDCFTDSIAYGDLITFTPEATFESKGRTRTGFELENLKWTNDGHYFTVHFPFVGDDLSKIESETLSRRWYMLFFLGLPLMFFGYSIFVILRQKRIAEVKNDFINNMTHELKTPISTIGLSSEMLLRGTVKEIEAVQKYASIIHKENLRLQNLVEKVLNIAKMDMEKIEISISTLSMHEILEEICETILFIHENDDVVFNFDLQAQNDRIKGDAIHITNIVNNLIDNAMKYSKDAPFVTLRSFNENNQFCIEISDQGVGIKKEDIKLIFDKFYRVSTGNLHNVKGFGLGLYYVQIIVNAHRGKIDIRSSFGKGTTVKVCFPLTK